MAKMGPKMIALCAAAIGIIYTTGYFITEPAVASLAQTAPSTVIAVANAQPNTVSSSGNSAGSASSGSSSGNSSTTNSSAGNSSTSNPSAGNSSTSSPSAGNSSTSSPSTSNNEANGGTSHASNGSGSTSNAAQASPYHDGTYYGQGSNRIGTVQVAVTVSQGKISACEITNCATHYPQSYIDPVLPQQVLQTQSANVDFVSGATRSSEDFAAAVQQALAQAQA